VHVDTWLSTYRGTISDSYLDSLSYESAERSARGRLEAQDESFTYVAETETGEIVGFAAAGPERDGNSRYKGELYAIYVLKARQKEGVGSLLLQAVAGRLVEMGIRSMLVWVLADNPSREFYERLGGRLLESEFIEIGDAEYEEVAYGWDDVTALLAQA